MWAAVSRSLEILVAFFEYYTTRTTGSPANKPAASGGGLGGGGGGTSAGGTVLTATGSASGTVLGCSGSAASGSGTGSSGTGAGNANASTSGIAGGNPASGSSAGTMVGGAGEPRTPTAGAQNKQLQNVKGDHPSKAFLQNRSMSLVDMYIDNSEPSENVGQIHFSLEYDFQNTTLILRIIQVSAVFGLVRPPPLLLPYP